MIEPVAAAQVAVENASDMRPAIGNRKTSNRQLIHAQPAQPSSIPPPARHRQLMPACHKLPRGRGCDTECRATALSFPGGVLAVGKDDARPALLTSHLDRRAAPEALEGSRASAALGWRVDGDLQPGPDRDGEVFALFGRRPDVIGWAATVDGRPNPDLLPKVRHFQTDDSRH